MSQWHHPSAAWHFSTAFRWYSYLQNLSKGWVLPAMNAYFAGDACSGDRRFLESGRRFDVEAKSSGRPTSSGCLPGSTLRTLNTHHKYAKNKQTNSRYYACISNSSCSLECTAKTKKPSTNYYKGANTCHSMLPSSWTNPIRQPRYLTTQSKRVCHSHHS